MLGTLLCSGLLALGAPASLTAGVILAFWILVTGALHEDGLADTSDGLWGGWQRERRLEIMRDSRIGTYGVLALVLSVILRWSALTLIISVSPAVLIVVGAASRAGMPPLMYVLDYARSDGLARSTGKPPRWSVIISSLLGLVALVAISPWMVLAVVVPIICVKIAQDKIGGYTGDILGATQQLGEIMILALLLIILV